MAGEQIDSPHSVDAAPQAAMGERRIRVLPSEVANQIAAGEVVERPASAVKELIENALDAGARHVTVELEQAGSGLIAVIDDGEGMSAADAACAFARHATSKLTGVDDLQRIATLGFRGEALASIAAVSSMTLVTRRPADETGTRVSVQHGRVVDVRETGSPVGTRVEVAELFGNTPARRKFLKSPTTETAHANELVTRTALAWPRVGFVLRHGTRTLIELAAADEEEERLRQVLGAERAKAMLSFAGREAAGYTCGWLSTSHLTFPTPRHIYTYVNRRYVRDKLLTHALIAGYSTLLMHGRYPAATVFLDVPLDEVDVNVHPAKSEVRFRRAGAVHELLVQAVQRRLREHGHDRAGVVATSVAPQLPSRLTKDWTTPSPSPATGPLRLVEAIPISAPLLPTGSPSESRPPLVNDRGHPAGFFGSLRVVGQVFGGYVVCESGEQLVLIDQHAAHERVTFERLRTAYGSGTVPRQQLLLPAIVDVGAREATLLNEQLSALDRFGFDLEPYGGASFAVRAVPALLGDVDPTTLLRDLAEDLTDVGRSRRVSEAAEAILARLACHSAVRVGQNLGADEIRALLEAMDRADFAGNCPHGRPAYISLSRRDLERWFKRT